MQWNFDKNAAWSEHSVRDRAAVFYLWKYAVIILRSGCYFALIHARFYILSSFAGEVSAGRISVPTVSVSPLTVNGRSSLPYTRRNILPSSA